MSEFKTKKEAEKACAKMIAQIENGQYIKETDETFGSYLLNYMENIAQHTVRQSTHVVRMYMVQKRIFSDIGRIKLKDLKPMHLQSFYTKKVKDELAASTIRHLHAIISQALKQAKEWGLIKENIASLVTPPRIEKKQAKTWSLEEVNKFLKIVEKRKDQKRIYSIIYTLAIYMGMRKGEILALRWQDCDLENGFLRIHQTLARIKGGVIFQEPKTKSSVRTIKMPDFVLQALKSHKIRQMEERLRLRTGYKDTDLVAAVWNRGNVFPEE